jgi:hypothetical protein
LSCLAIGRTRLSELHRKTSGYDRAERKDITASAIDGLWHLNSKNQHLTMALLSILTRKSGKR